MRNTPISEPTNDLPARYSKGYSGGILGVLWGYSGYSGYSKGVLWGYSIGTQRGTLGVLWGYSGYSKGGRAFTSVVDVDEVEEQLRHLAPTINCASRDPPL